MYRSMHRKHSHWHWHTVERREIEFIPYTIGMDLGRQDKLCCVVLGVELFVENDFDSSSI